MIRKLQLPILCATVLVAAWATSAQGASYVSDTDVILNPYENLVEPYGLKTEWITSIGLPKISTTSVRMSNPTGGVSPPGPGQTLDSFFDIFVEISLEGPGLPPISGAIRSFSKMKGDYLPAHNWKIEIDGLIVSSGGLPTGVMIRESPTLQSLGRTSIEPLPDGLFKINSFFDIFTELTVDGGETWFPASGPMHLESVPEPSSVVLAAVGFCGLVVYRRHRRKGRLPANVATPAQ